MRWRFGIAFVGAALLAATGASLAQEPQIEIKRTNLAKGIYMLRGVGGNTSVIAGRDGVLIVDDQVAEVAAQIKLEIQRLSTQPIRFVLNTHWHQDHTGGNQALATSGSTIVAHENVRSRMNEEQFLEIFNKRVPASPVGSLPVVTYVESMTLHLNDEEIHLFHVPAAHTDGDSIVHFRSSNVLHVGDVYFNGMYPYIDLASGGSIDGMIAGVDRALAVANEQTKIVPGHGELSDRASLAAYRDMLATVRDRIAEEIAADKSLREVQETKPTAELDSTWGRGFIKPEQFVDMVFSSLSQ